MSAKMTLALAHDSKTDPVRAAAFVKLVSDMPLTYKPRPLVGVNIGWGGVGAGHEEATSDGEAAFSAALLYWATGNQVYADLACAVVRAWATTNTSWKGDNAILEASWSVCSMARAAELLKWSPAKAKWMQVEPLFYHWLDAVIMPVLKSEVIWGWPIVGNWHFSQICARMQLAILREDMKEWEWCTKRYLVALPKGLLCKMCPGQVSETTRDVTHSAFEIGGMTQAAEMAHHQGLDLYDPRLIDACELQATLLMKTIPPGLTKDDIHTPYGYFYEPVLELPFTHFNGRLRLAMPKCAQLLSMVRPERVTFHWGAGTLTHYGRT